MGSLEHTSNTPRSYLETTSNLPRTQPVSPPCAPVSLLGYPPRTYKGICYLRIQLLYNLVLRRGFMKSAAGYLYLEWPDLPGGAGRCRGAGTAAGCAAGRGGLLAGEQDQAGAGPVAGRRSVPLYVLIYGKRLTQPGSTRIRRFFFRFSRMMRRVTGSPPVSHFSIRRLPGSGPAATATLQQ